jgi:auxin influx carrier (AUX1 LAX family)
MGCWACYMIAWLYIEYRTRQERQGHTFKNHVIQVAFFASSL